MLHAVLLELGMSRLCHVVAKLQLSYISQVFLGMGGTSVHDMLIAEHEVMGDKITPSLAGQLAVKYGMKPLTEEYADKKLVKKMVKDFSDRELWEDSFLSGVKTISESH